MCTRVHAERDVHVVATGTPFSADDLAAALRVRLATQGAPIAVAATAVADRVTVTVGDTTREVALDGRVGADAARLVALEIVDLALDDLAVVPRAEPMPSPVAIALYGGAMAWTSTLANASADVALGRGRWRAAIELAGSQRVAGVLHVTGATVRLCGALRAGELELRGGAVIAPTWVSDGVGDQTTLVGATASARVHVGRLLLAVGLDAYATQTTYSYQAMTVTTPWIAPWVAAGVELVP
jgi:hypothetical protein